MSDSIINWVSQFAMNVIRPGGSEKALECANQLTTEEVTAGKENHFVDNYKFCKSRELGAQLAPKLNRLFSNPPKK